VTLVVNALADSGATIGRRRLMGVAASLLLAWAPVYVAAHGAGSQSPERSVARYATPEVTLLSQDRVELRLRELLEVDGPVLVNFIFTTCTTICPILSAGFSNLQGMLGEEASRVQLVSISIDPEHDTPEVLKQYQRRYRGKAGWEFLTGSRADIDKVMRAFDTFVPDKMSHRPVQLLRSSRDGRWVRIDGFVSGAYLMKEYRSLVTE
jgi:protein SCO1/2